MMITRILAAVMLTTVAGAALAAGMDRRHEPPPTPTTTTTSGSTASAGTSLPPPAGFTASQKIFEDQFTTPALDTTKWNPWLGDDVYGRWSDQGHLASPYSGNNCNSTCSNSYQIMYDDPFSYGDETGIDSAHLVGGSGYLIELANPDAHFSTLGYSWASAAISSYGHAYLPATGGYVQWSAKMPDSRYGAWGGLWLLSANGAELDVQESGYISGSAPVNQILASNWHGTGGQQIIQNTGEDLSAAYHTYGVEYIPGKSWTAYLDGKQMASWTTGVPTNAKYQVLIDMEIAGPSANGWHTVADPVNHPGPYELDVDDVQIYSLSTAAISAPSVTTTRQSPHKHK